MCAQDESFDSCECLESVSQDAIQSHLSLLGGWRKPEHPEETYSYCNNVEITQEGAEKVVSGCLLL